MKRRLIILDNYDSFTWNLFHYVEAICDDELLIFQNDDPHFPELSEHDRLILSPGPGLPDESGFLMKHIYRYIKNVPMLGICLGHQALALASGASLYNLDHPLHGIARTTVVKPEFYSDKLFINIPDRITTGHYHSWVVNAATIDDQLAVLAVDEEQSVMIIKHKIYPFYGMQFHPESVMTPFGKQLLSNWLNIA